MLVAAVAAVSVTAAAAYIWYVRTPSLDAPPLLAEETGSIVIYPDAHEGGWNDCRSAAASAARNAGVDDVALAAAIVDRLVAERSVDPAGVFAVGFSNGGQLVHRLAAEDPDRYAGLAVIAATRPTDANWLCMTEPASVPRLFIHGTEDSVAPYDGGENTLFGRDLGPALSVADSAARAAATNGITSAPRSENLVRDENGDPAVQQQRWTAPGKDPVVVLTAIGAGHTIPSAVTRGPRVFGATSTAMDTPTEVWRFFDLERPT